MLQVVTGCNKVLQGGIMCYRVLDIFAIILLPLQIRQKSLENRGEQEL